MESILGETSLGNLNYAPMNTNVQNFVNINTEIDTDIDINVSFYKVGCVFPMVISSEFRMEQHRDDDHQEDVPHFIN